MGSQVWTDGRTKTNIAPKNVHTLFFLVVGEGSNVEPRKAHSEQTITIGLLLSQPCKTVLFHWECTNSPRSNTNQKTPNKLGSWAVQKQVSTFLAIAKGTTFIIIALPISSKLTDVGYHLKHQPHKDFLAIIGSNIRTLSISYQIYPCVATCSKYLS